MECPPSIKECFDRLGTNDCGNAPHCPQCDTEVDPEETHFHILTENQLLRLCERCWAKGPLPEADRTLELDFQERQEGRKQSHAAKAPRISQSSSYLLAQVRRRWSKPLEMLEEVISLGEALGTDSRSPRFESMNDAYWAAMRSLHARTCLHARGVLALLSNGLVDPAWPQWRVCHESSTIARFIAEKPEMAPRYLNYSYVNKYQMARELYEIESNQAPGNVELNNLKKLADRVQQDLEKDYGHSQSSRDYGWSGRRSFKDIEAEVSKGDAWNPRGEYRLSSERVHSASNAGEPFREDGGRLVFVVGPKNSGLTGPVDLTSIAITRATMALLLNASCSRQDLNKLRELSIKSRLPGALSWIVDPEIICTRCGGHVKGASPPELMPEEQRPKPCTCVKARRRRANRASPTRTRSAPGRSQEEDGC